MNVIKKILLFGVMLCIGSSMMAEGDAVTGENLCPDPGFATWKCSSGYRLAPGEGMDGNTALSVERTDPKSYVLMGQSIKGLKKNMIYNFGVWVKSEKVSSADAAQGATICIEYSNKGKFLCGDYPIGIDGTRDWTLISGKTTTPAEFDSASITLYLRRGVTGKAWFCYPYIKEDVPEWRASLLSPVMNQAIRGGQQELIFNSYTYGINDVLTDNLKVKTESVCDGKTESISTVPVKNNRFAVNTSLNPGAYPLKLTLMNGEKEIAATEIPIQVLAPTVKEPSNTVRIDDKGRTWVNGKKFLPVGMFTNHHNDVFKKWNHCWRKSDIENMKNSPFNCIMPYDAAVCKFEGTRLAGIDAVREVMDELDRIGLKVIFSLKDFAKATDSSMAITRKTVETYRNHPALIAWYVNDEEEITKFDIDKRALIGQLDPFHPTWQVQNLRTYYPQRSGVADIFGIDSYPVRDDSRDMERVRKDMKVAVETFGFNGNIALWGVPQAFSWANYDKTAKDVFPSETQLRSMPLLMAVMGAKGFVLYIYSALFQGDDSNKKFAGNWPVICRVAQMLRDLEPFLLSDAPNPKMEVKTIKGQIEARAFAADDGRVNVIVTAIGPGEAEATIKINGGDKLKSKYGCSTLGQDGIWTFTGKDIDSDILFN
jgi:hypothetical protein